MIRFLIMFAIHEYVSQLESQKIEIKDPQLMLLLVYNFCIDLIVSVISMTWYIFFISICLNNQQNKFKNILARLRNRNNANPNNYVQVNNLDANGNVIYLDDQNNGNQVNAELMGKKVNRFLDMMCPKENECFEQTEDQECSICLNIMDIQVELPCEHKFDKNCLKQWWEKDGNFKCPMCNHVQKETVESVKL